MSSGSPELWSQLRTVMSVMHVGVSLAVALTAAVVAVICTQRRSSPLAAWLLATGFAGDFGYNLLTTVFYRSNFFFQGLPGRAFFWVNLGFGLVSLFALWLVVLGLLLFRNPRPAVQPNAEVARG